MRRKRLLSMFVIPLVLGAMVFASAESPSTEDDLRKLQSAIRFFGVVGLAATVIYLL